MQITDWLPPRREAPGPAPARPEARAAPTAASAASTRLHLDAQALPTAWRAADGLLDLRAHEPVASGACVTITVTGAGAPVALRGTVHAAVAGRAGVALAIAPDADGQALLARLARALRGEEPLPRPRAARYRVALPVVVTGRGGVAFMTATSISEGGCGLAWSGMAPRLGAGLLLRLGSGPRAFTVRAMTCWIRETPRGLRVGLRFLTSDQPPPGLASLLEDARRTAA